MINLMTGVYSHFTKTTGGIHNSFYTAIGGRLYNTQAPETATLPYVVYTLISGVPSWNFSKYFFETIRIQFDIFSKTEDDAEVQDIYTKLNDLYNWTTLTINNNAFLYMRRELTRLTRESEPQASYWHYTVDYEIMTEHVVSESPSASPSLSPSASASPSVSPSLSPSASASPSASPSKSPSASPSG